MDYVNIINSIKNDNSTDQLVKLKFDIYNIIDKHSLIDCLDTISNIIYNYSDKILIVIIIKYDNENHISKLYHNLKDIIEIINNSNSIFHYYCITVDLLLNDILFYKNFLEIIQISYYNKYFIVDDNITVIFYNNNTDIDNKYLDIFNFYKNITIINNEKFNIDFIRYLINIINSYTIFNSDYYPIDLFKFISINNFNTPISRSIDLSDFNFSKELPFYDINYDFIYDNKKMSYVIRYLSKTVEYENEEVKELYYDGNITKMLFCYNNLRSSTESLFKLWFKIDISKAESNSKLLYLFFKFIRIYEINSNIWTSYKFFYDTQPCNFILYLDNEITENELFNLIRMLKTINIITENNCIIYLGLANKSGSSNQLVTLSYNTDKDIISSSISDDIISILHYYL